MPPLYNYTGFGLLIASEIEFPELMPTKNDQPDIFIREGLIPHELFPDKDVSRVHVIYKEKDFLLNLPGIAKYHVTEGKIISIEPYPASDPGSVRLFLLSITMAALLTQRQKILLHASAIILNEKLILFIGESGAGKSSIAAEFSRRGYTLFTDDVCVLDTSIEKSDQVWAYASYPMMKLWDDTILALDHSEYDRSHKIRPSLPKFGQFFHEKFITTAYPIQNIFVLNPLAEGPEGYSIKRILGMEAFEKLSKHTYRKQFIQESSSLQAIHLKLMGTLIREKEVIEITRSKKYSDINSFANFVESLILK